jgi:hypothetical protein
MEEAKAIIAENANGIYDSGACIKIMLNGNSFYINKAQIKTIDTIRNDSIRIDIGEGALKNVYVKLADVQYPQSFTDAAAIRDYIVGLMIQNALVFDPSFSNLFTNLLQEIKLALQNSQGGGKTPLREDESQPYVIYKGYAAPNANTYDAVWAIQKITRLKDEIIYEWANGNDFYDNVWDNRFVVQYFPSGFIVPVI